MTEKLVLNMGMIDWLTVTSWEDGYWRRFAESQGYKTATGERDGWKETRFLQYAGVTKSLGLGKVFCGAGYQKDRLHNLCYASGAAAHLLAGDMVAVSDDYKVSRVDFQVTTAMPDDWSQWRFFNRMKRAGKKVGWFESVDRDSGKKLETVYVGSRQSDRFIRLYVKLDDDGNELLRFEVEYKSKRADTVGKKYARKGEDERIDFIEGTLLFEVQRLNDGDLSNVFENVIAGMAVKTKVSVVKGKDKTRSWLMGQVLPSFKRYIADHDSDADVSNAFRQAIESAGLWQDE